MTTRRLSGIESAGSLSRAHRAISPARHLVQGQVCPVDGRRFPPYRDSQAQNNQPERCDDERTSKNVGLQLGRWRLQLRRRRIRTGRIGLCGRSRGSVRCVVVAISLGPRRPRRRFDFRYRRPVFAVSNC